MDGGRGRRSFFRLDTAVALQHRRAAELVSPDHERRKRDSTEAEAAGAENVPPRHRTRVFQAGAEMVAGLHEASIFLSGTRQD
jgi:hypothetical protein